MTDKANEGSQGGAPRYKRSARNYLLDRHFQLKYAGFLMGVALVFALGLGALLFVSSTEIVAQSRVAVNQGRQTVRLSQATVERGKEVIKQSRRVSQVVAMNIAKEYADSPELAKTFQEEANKDEKKLEAEQNQLESDAKYLTDRAVELEAQAAAVETQQRVLLLGLIGGLVVLVLAIGAAGIVFTHKIAGPIFKMKRLMREVGEGKLILREKLRKGDELQHFFDAFEKTVNQLRKKQEDEIARVDAILEQLAPVAADNPGVEELKKLRAEMLDHIQP